MGQTMFRLILYAEPQRGRQLANNIQFILCSLELNVRRRPPGASSDSLEKKPPKYLKPNCISIILITPSSEYMYVSCKQVYLRAHVSTCNFDLRTEYNVTPAASIPGAHLARYLPNMRPLLSLIAHIRNFIGSWSEERLE